MATTYSSLASLKPAANTLTVLYTAPALTKVIVNCLTIANNSGAADAVEVQFRPSAITGFFIANVDMVSGAPLAGNDVRKIDPFELSPGDSIYVNSLNGTTSFFLSGVLIT